MTHNNLLEKHKTLTEMHNRLMSNADEMSNSLRAIQFTDNNTDKELRDIITKIQQTNNEQRHKIDALSQQNLELTKNTDVVSGLHEQIVAQQVSFGEKQNQDKLESVAKETEFNKQLAEIQGQYETVKLENNKLTEQNNALQQSVASMGQQQPAQQLQQQQQSQPQQLGGAVHTETGPCPCCDCARDGYKFTESANQKCM